MILMLPIPNKNYFLQHLIGTIVEHKFDLFIAYNKDRIQKSMTNKRCSLSNYTLFLVFSAKRTFHDGARSCLSLSSWFPARNPSFKEVTEVVVTKIKMRNLI